MFGSRSVKRDCHISMVAGRGHRNMAVEVVGNRRATWRTNASGVESQERLQKQKDNFKGSQVDEVAVVKNSQDVASERVVRSTEREMVTGRLTELKDVRFQLRSKIVKQQENTDHFKEFQVDEVTEE